MASYSELGSSGAADLLLTYRTSQPLHRVIASKLGQVSAEPHKKSLEFIHNVVTRTAGTVALPQAEGAEVSFKDARIVVPDAVFAVLSQTHEFIS